MILGAWQLNTWITPGPLAFAHRGGAARQPENTAAAFDHAARLGYAYLETDARSTADGKLIAFHDADLNRATDRAGQVSKLPWREVSAARVGGTEPIPLLEDVLGTFPELRFNIDLKDAGTIEPLAGVLRRTQAWDRVCITSFSGGGCWPRSARWTAPSAWRSPRRRSWRSGTWGTPAGRWPDGLVRSGALCAQVPPQIATRDFISRAHQLGLSGSRLDAEHQGGDRAGARPRRGRGDDRRGGVAARHSHRARRSGIRGCSRSSDITDTRELLTRPDGRKHRAD